MTQSRKFLGIGPANLRAQFFIPTHRVCCAARSHTRQHRIGRAQHRPRAEQKSSRRATGKVRCRRLLKGEDILLLAWAGTAPAVAAAASGPPVDLPPATGKRDGSSCTVGTHVAIEHSDQPAEDHRTLKFSPDTEGSRTPTPYPRINRQTQASLRQRLPK